MELLFCPQANGAPELSNQSSAFVFFVLILGAKILEPKQFKNNLIMIEDKPQFEFAA